MCCSLNSFRKAFTCPVFYALLNYYFAAEVQLIIVSYWTGSRIFFNDALEHNEWCGRMLASLTSHVFARGHVLPYYVIRSLGSLMVACLVTTLLYAALNSLVAWVLVRVYSWVRWELDDEAWAFVSEGDFCWKFRSLIFQHLSQSIFPLLGILALRMLPKFVFPRKEWTSGSRRERSDDEQWLSTRVCRVIFNWFTYHASCMYRIG